MNAYTMASKFVGLRELAGEKNNGFIQWAHTLCGLGSETPDEVPWCSSFANAVAWLCDLQRSKSAAARSWLLVGTPVDLGDAKLGDVVVFKRGSGVQPGGEVRYEDGRWPPGHVAFYGGEVGDHILALGGNQGDAVSVAKYPKSSLLGVRRL